MIAQSCQCPVSGETAQVVLADSTLTGTLLLRGWESFRKLECELRFAPRVAIHNQRIFGAARACPIHYERNIHNVGSANEAIAIG